MSLNLEHLHRVHCVGVGGIGVSAVAKFLRLQDKEVSGSDASRSEVTEDAARAGVIIKDESAENVTPDLDLLIYTSAAPEDHPERRQAAAYGIPQFSYAEFLGLLSRAYETVAVCGTDGKSTTTAMLGLILEAAGLDPLVIVGSRVPSFEYGNLRPGKGRIFVVEACEYLAAFLNLSPKRIVVTNITEDHLDFYRDLEHIRETFQAFIDKLPSDGLLVRNADDSTSGRLEPKVRSVSYGFDRSADFRAADLKVGGGLQRFEVSGREPAEDWGGLSLKIPGAFNVHNALAAAAMARELGVAPEIIRQTLAEFAGIWRRFEHVGSRNGAPVISDYGHTPEGIRATLAGAREFYPDRRILLVYEPHQHARTFKLLDQLVEAFDGADVLVLSEIYGVPGRLEGEGNVSSRDLVAAVAERDKKTGRRREAVYAASPEAALEEARRLARADDLIIVMGAGPIYRIAGRLASDKA